MTIAGDRPIDKNSMNTLGFNTDFLGAEDVDESKNKFTSTISG